jgi:hypothetical protein
MYDKGLSFGLIFSFAGGKTLDRYADIMCDGMKRKRFLFIKETDISFKGRILEKEMIKKGMINQ